MNEKNKIKVHGFANADVLFVHSEGSVVPIPKLCIVVSRESLEADRISYSQLYFCQQKGGGRKKRREHYWDYIHNIISYTLQQYNITHSGKHATGTSDE